MRHRFFSLALSSRFVHCRSQKKELTWENDEQQQQQKWNWLRFFTKYTIFLRWTSWMFVIWPKRHHIINEKPCGSIYVVRRCFDNKPNVYVTSGLMTSLVCGFDFKYLFQLASSFGYNNSWTCLNLKPVHTFLISILHSVRLFACRCVHSLSEFLTPNTIYQIFSNLNVIYLIRTFDGDEFCGQNKLSRRLKTTSRAFQLRNGSRFCVTFCSFFNVMSQVKEGTTLEPAATSSFDMILCVILRHVRINWNQNNKLPTNKIKTFRSHRFCLLCLERFFFSLLLKWRKINKETTTTEKKTTIKYFAHKIWDMEGKFYVYIKRINSHEKPKYTYHRNRKMCSFVYMRN